MTTEDGQIRYIAIQNYRLKVNKPVLLRLQFLISRRRVPPVGIHGTAALLPTLTHSVMNTADPTSGLYKYKTAKL
jgi:hypothetical protein